MCVRPPAVADLFYPGNAQRLRETVTAFLHSAEISGQNPKAIIAPHAGYIYSGATAGIAYAQLLPSADQIERVIMLGPAHRVRVDGLAVPTWDEFASPLGNLPVDREALNKISDLPQVVVSDAAHAPEHSLETHLPFLQCVLDMAPVPAGASEETPRKPVKIVPIVVGDATPAQVAEVLEKIWGGPETLIAISSDLSHFYSYEEARELDAATARAIERLRPQDIRFEQACGRIPINGLLLLAPRYNLRAKTLDLRNSGDTAGDKDSVVGYGAWAFYSDT